MKKLLLFIILSISINSYAQQVIYVDSAATGSNDGSTWQNAYTQIQDAITNAIANDELWVAKGTYYPTEDIIGNSSPANPRVKTILINKNITIYGGFIGTETLLNQRDWELNTTLFSGDIGIAGDKTDNCNRVVFVTSDAMLDGISVKGAYIPSSYGGALNVNGSIFSLSNCTISDNETYSGAGMYIQASSSVGVDNCKFYNNVAANKGGAILLETGNIKVINSVFDGNVAGYGGAVSLEGGTTQQCKIINSLFSNNQTSLYGGTAVFAFAIQGGVKIVNSTFVRNNCPTCTTSNTGAIRSNGVNFILQNTIVWDDIPFSEASNNLNLFFTVNNSVIKNGFTGNNNLSVYPQFIDTLNNNFTLQSNSVAINAGDSIGFSSEIPLVDVNGDSRYIGSSIDIGCYEYQLSTSIKEKVENKLSLYPNPTKSHITIANLQSNIINVTILDVTGKVVKSITPNTNMIDVSNLISGVYFIKVQTEKGVSNNKFIKE